MLFKMTIVDYVQKKIADLEESLLCHCSMGADMFKLLLCYTVPGVYACGLGTFPVV